MILCIIYSNLPPKEENRFPTKKWTASSMAHEVFIDTSGFYALLVKKDDRHLQASNFMREAAKKRLRFVTTDYVLDETATLFQARGHVQISNKLLQLTTGTREADLPVKNNYLWSSSDSLIHPFVSLQDTAYLQAAYFISLPLPFEGCKSLQSYRSGRRCWHRLPDKQSASGQLRSAGTGWRRSD